MFLLVSQSSLALLLPLLTLSLPPCLFVCVFLATLAPFSSLLEQLQQILWHFGAQNSERTTANMRFIEFYGARRGATCHTVCGRMPNSGCFFFFHSKLGSVFLSVCLATIQIPSLTANRAWKLPRGLEPQIWARHISLGSELERGDEGGV